MFVRVTFTTYDKQEGQVIYSSSDCLESSEEILENDSLETTVIEKSVTKFVNSLHSFQYLSQDEKV